jgi:8-oxo-dGTP pyrophosphatase MutT (NUDIX family)
VVAAGGVVRRREADGRLRVAVVHRPRRDDWSLPKGKLEPGEALEAAALREVEEETGARCRIRRPLPEVRYRLPDGRTKAVRFYLMDALAVSPRPPDAEVDEVAWLTPAEAEACLSYPSDRRLLNDALGGDDRGGQPSG